jgi:2'-5' RNA ligase
MYLFASSEDGSDALLTMLRDTFDAADGSRYEIPLAVASEQLALVEVPAFASLTDDGAAAEFEFWCKKPDALPEPPSAPTAATDSTHPSTPTSSLRTVTAPPASGHETALVILLDGELGSRIQAIRRRLDGAHVDRWPAHITLCYPFVPAAQLHAVLPHLNTVCSGIPPLNLSFRTFGHFDHGQRRGCVTWLRPEPERAVRALHAALTNKLKSLGVDCPRLSQPHCTVARGQSEPQGKMLASDWSPQSAHVVRIVALQRDGNARDSPMREVASLPLGQGRDGGTLLTLPSPRHVSSITTHIRAEDADTAPHPPATVRVTLQRESGGASVDRSLDVVQCAATGGAALALQLAYAEHRINTLSTSVASVTRPAVEEIQNILRAAGHVFGLHGISRQRRGELLLLRKDLQARLDQLHALVEAKARRQATRDDSLVSRMSDLRFKGQLHARRARALQRRAASNAGKDQAAAVLRGLAPYNRGAEGALQGGEEARAFYTCTMTCADVEELLSDGPEQVLGFGLAVRRPEAVVDSPTLIHVDRVTSTFLARDAFLDATEFKLSDVLEDAADVAAAAMAASNVHGGFDMRPPEEAHATVGRCREPINAWLPLYVCPQHWRRARVLLPATLGYLCCLDPLAFHEYQYDVPLVVLGSLAAATARHRGALGQHDARLLFAVQRMARAVVEDAGRLEEHVHARLRVFVADPNARLRHNLSSLLTVLGTLLVADPAEAEAAVRGGFFTHVRHEALRRAAGTLLRERSPSACADMVDRLLFSGQSASSVALDDEEVASLLAGIGAVQDTATLATGGGSDSGGGTAEAVSSDRAIDPSAKFAMQADASLPLALSVRAQKALTNVGLHLRGALPGPNVEKKAKAATRIADEWWEGRLQAARDLVGGEECSSDSLGAARLNASERLDAGQAKALVSATQQLLKVAFPTFGQIAAVERVTTAWLDIAADPAAPAFFDALAPASACTHLQRVLAVGPCQPAGRTAGQMCLDAFGGRWQRVRAAVIQSIELHSNSNARRAAQPGGELVEGTQPDFEVRAAEVAVRRRREADADAREARAKGMRQQMALQHLVEERDLDAFVALLNAATGGQREATYKELYELMLAHPRAVQGLVPKLEVMLTGRIQEHRVFARGNGAIPTGVQSKALKSAIGEEAYSCLNVKFFGSVGAHVYRGSDIPNRHGHSNSNPHLPWQCDLCMANGNWSGRR